MRNRIVLACLFVAVASQPALAQSATSCVEQTWSAFRAEVEGKEDPRSETGDAYLTAFGWVRATEACLEVATYPANQKESADQFRQSVARTSDAIEQAIRTDTAPLSIFASASGGNGRLFYTYPDGPPSGGSGGITGTLGTVLTVPQNSGVVMTDRVQGNARPATNYRMLSMREIFTIQAKLTRLGFDTGGVDGIAGPRTYAAIERYQRSLGLRPTGLLDSRQIAALLE